MDMDMDMGIVRFMNKTSCNVLDNVKENVQESVQGIILGRNCHNLCQ